LTAATREFFDRDLMERDADGYTRLVAIFAFAAGSSGWSTRQTFAKSLETFTDGRSSEMKLAIIQFGDSDELIFCDVSPEESVRRIIIGLDLNVADAVNVRPYKSLGPRRIESMAAELVNVAFPR
jgi:hypothetical protein